MGDDVFSKQCTVVSSIGVTLSKDTVETVIVRNISARLISAGRVMEADSPADSEDIFSSLPSHVPEGSAIVQSF